MHLLDARLAADRHALAAAEASGSQHLQLNALLYGIADLTEAGDIPEAYRWFLRLKSLAAEVRQPVYDAFVGFFDATVALLRGEYDRSAQLADEALLRGLQSHGVNAEQAWSGQAFIRAWDRGELSTMTALVEQAAARPPHLAIWKVALGACLVASGRGDEARPLLDELITPTGIDHNPDSLYLAIGALLVEIAREVGTPEHAALLCQHLLPYRGRIIITGLGRAVAGTARPVHRAGRVPGRRPRPGRRTAGRRRGPVAGDDGRSRTRPGRCTTAPKCSTPRPEAAATRPPSCARKPCAWPTRSASSSAASPPPSPADPRPPTNFVAPNLLNRFPATEMRSGSTVEAVLACVRMWPCSTELTR